LLDPADDDLETVKFEELKKYQDLENFYQFQNGTLLKLNLKCLEWTECKISNPKMLPNFDEDT
jgi:hypothetical protein